MSVASNIVGTWLSDWQNAALGGCLPTSIVINETPFDVVYNFPSQAGTTCPQDSTAHFVNYQLGTYQDSAGNYLTYNATVDTLMFWFKYNHNLYLYDRNGSFIPQEALPPLSTFTGVWYSPNTSCVINDYANSIFINAVESSTSPCYVLEVITIPPKSSFPISQNNITLQPSFQAFNWSGETGWGYISIYYSPYESNPLSMTFEAGFCQLPYQRYNQTLISGTWLRDTQDTPELPTETYQIQIVDNLYMTSILTNTTTGTSETGIVFQATNSQNQYCDTIIEVFTYDPQLNVVVPNNGYAFYSQNGSLFSNRDVIGNWSNAHTEQSQCCMPQLIQITNNTHDSDISILYVNYYFSQQLSTSSACERIASNIVDGNGVVSSSLVIQGVTISPDQSVHANWNDCLGFEIMTDNDWSDYQTYNIDESIPIISVEFQGCKFIMELDSRPNPLESSRWKPSGLILLVIGTIMMLACI